MYITSNTFLPVGRIHIYNRCRKNATGTDWEELTVLTTRTFIDVLNSGSRRTFAVNSFTSFLFYYVNPPD